MGLQAWFRYFCIFSQVILVKGTFRDKAKKLKKVKSSKLLAALICTAILEFFVVLTGTDSCCSQHGGCNPVIIIIQHHLLHGRPIN
jgi:hypothetical protein